MKVRYGHALVRFKRAFESVRGDLDAVSLSEAPAINLDVPLAVETVLRSVNNLKPYRPALAQLASFDVARVEKLKTYAQALLYAHERYVGYDVPFDGTGHAKRELSAMRETLIECTRPLVARSLMDASSLPRLTGGAGVEKLASHVIELSDFYRASWPSIVNRTSVTLDELNYDVMRAERICIGLRMHRELASEAAETRRRAFCLMVGAYSEARRGVGFLRWHEGDVDTIVPSLYTGKGGRKRQPHG